MPFRCVEFDKEEILFGGYSAATISESHGNEGGHCNSVYKASRLEEVSLESGSSSTAHLERRKVLEKTSPVRACIMFLTELLLVFCSFLQCAGKSKMSISFSV